MSNTTINSSKPFMDKFHFVSTDMNHERGLKKNVIHVNKKLEGGNFQEHNFMSISQTAMEMYCKCSTYYSMQGGIKHTSEGQTITRCGKKKLTPEKQKHARNRNLCEAVLSFIFSFSVFVLFLHFQGIHICLSAQ